MDLVEVSRALEERLSRLTSRVSKIEKDLRKSGSDDWQERATERLNDEVLEQLNETERAEIESIRAALERIRDGTYADCSRCGDAISPARLEALPYTNLCIECAN